MEITLYNTTSEKNEINKTISNGQTFTGTLRDMTSILNPEINIESNLNLSAFNYCHISEFGRYYFIKDVKSVRNGLWRISLKVDVLMSFKVDILASQGILKHTETFGEPYLSDNSWENLVKDKTDILTFSNGLLDSGEYILITAGG